MLPQIFNWVKRTEGKGSSSAQAPIAKAPAQKVNLETVVLDDDIVAPPASKVRSSPKKKKKKKEKKDKKENRPQKRMREVVPCEKVGEPSSKRAQIGLSRFQDALLCQHGKWWNQGSSQRGRWELLF